MNINKNDLTLRATVRYTDNFDLDSVLKALIETDSPKPGYCCSRKRRNKRKEIRRWILHRRGNNVMD